MADDVLRDLDELEPFATVEVDSLFRTEPSVDTPRREVPSQSSLLPPEDEDSLPALSALPKKPAPGFVMEVPVERYEDRGRLGVGGMGEVRRVRDRVLRRTMAMKLLHPRLRLSARSVARFIEEAQIAAQLAHPGVIPVYDLGQRSDGRWYFTMQEVKGKTFAQVIRALHTGSGESNFRRVIDAFLRVCETIAYAHARGVIHRDLKPGNVMLSGFGRVMVLDWGLARVLADATEDVSEEVVETARSENDALQTVVGTITGTPAYMSPEQASGRQDLIGPHTDVYALGAILYEILAGHPPYMGISAQAVMQAVLNGPPSPPSGPIGVPETLSALCMQAMDHDLARRPKDAGFLVQGISDWLDGAVRRERAAAMVAQADTLRPEVDRLYASARQLRRQAGQALHNVSRHAPVEDKLVGWTLEEQAEAATQQARLKEAEWMQHLHGALTADPSLTEASERLADFYQRRHVEAERKLDQPATIEAEMMLRVHDRGRYAAYLKGDGVLTLLTEPSGAIARLYQYREIRRRLEPVFVENLGQTPILERTLPMGSYMIRLEMPDRENVDLPVNIDRQQRWENIRPGEHTATPIWLPPKGALGVDECYVPAGYFWSGDPLVANASRRVLRWVDAFVMERYPITNRRFIMYLNDSDWAHANADAMDSEFDVTSYCREGDVWSLGPDADGEVWEEDWPVHYVDWYRAMDFASWYSHQRGQGWTLPTRWQWEKSARGVDGRSYPWGRYFDVNWCRNRYSLPGRLALAAVQETPMDRSPYGVIGTAGNVLEWCRSEESRDTETVQPIRGGNATMNAENCRLANNRGRFPASPQMAQGFRILRNLEPPFHGEHT